MDGKFCSSRILVNSFRLLDIDAFPSCFCPYSRAPLYNHSDHSVFFFSLIRLFSSNAILSFDSHQRAAALTASTSHSFPVVPAQSAPEPTKCCPGHVPASAAWPSGSSLLEITLAAKSEASGQLQQSRHLSPRPHPKCSNKGGQAVITKAVYEVGDSQQLSTIWGLTAHSNHSTRCLHQQMHYTRLNP